MSGTPIPLYGEAVRDLIGRTVAPLHSPGDPLTPETAGRILDALSRALRPYLSESRIDRDGTIHVTLQNPTRYMVYKLDC